MQNPKLHFRSQKLQALYPIFFFSIYIHFHKSSL